MEWKEQEQEQYVFFKSKLGILFKIQEGKIIVVGTESFQTPLNSTDSLQSKQSPKVEQPRDSDETTNAKEVSTIDKKGISTPIEKGTSAECETGYEDPGESTSTPYHGSATC